MTSGNEWIITILVQLISGAVGIAAFSAWIFVDMAPKRTGRWTRVTIVLGVLLYILAMSYFASKGVFSVAK